MIWHNILKGDWIMNLIEERMMMVSIHWIGMIFISLFVLGGICLGDTWAAEKPPYGGTLYFACEIV